MRFRGFYFKGGGSGAKLKAGKNINITNDTINLINDPIIDNKNLINVINNVDTNTALISEIDINKQDKLIAGKNITITGNTISATGSGGGGGVYHKQLTFLMKVNINATVHLDTYDNDYKEFYVTASTYDHQRGLVYKNLNTYVPFIFDLFWPTSTYGGELELQANPSTPSTALVNNTGVGLSIYGVNYVV